MAWAVQRCAGPAQSRPLAGIVWWDPDALPHHCQHSDHARATCAGGTGESWIGAVQQHGVRQQWGTIQVHGKLAGEAPATLTRAPEYHHLAQHRAGPALQRDADPAVQLGTITDDGRLRLPVEEGVLRPR